MSTVDRGAGRPDVDTGLVVVSFSDGYGVGDPEQRVAAHFTSYQDGLAAAAAAVGHRLEPLGPTPEAPGGAMGAAARIGARLAEAPADLAIVYEGSLAHLEPFDELATEHPGTRFLVNLFKSQRHLDTPRERGVRRKDRKTLRLASDGSLESLTERLRRLELPPNLVLTAETERRALLARSLGLPIVAVWPLHSQLAESPLPPTVERSAGAPLRVLTQVQWHKATEATFAEIASIVRLVERHARPGPEFRWSLAGLAGWADPPRAVRRHLRALERLGVRVTDRALSDAAYRTLYDEHDVVWLPLRGIYNVQSSAKALDALVRGIPVLAPAGSYGAAEQARWVPGAPSYGSTLEAVELLLRFRTLADVLGSELRARGEDVRRAYSVSGAYARLLDLAGLGLSRGVR